MWCLHFGCLRTRREAGEGGERGVRVMGGVVSDAEAQLCDVTPRFPDDDTSTKSIVAENNCISQLCQ
jgi:hypothetical protein